MKSISKALGLLLLSVVSAAAIAPPALSATAHPLPNAGCHEHAQKTSPAAPASANYICCQRGHHTALLQDSFAAGRDSGLQCVKIVETTATVLTAAPALLSLDRLSSASPPSPAPLRI